MACSAVLGIDGDYVEGGAGGMAGAPNGGSGTGANGGSGGTHAGGGSSAGGGASSGGAPTTGGGGVGPLPLGAPCTDRDQCEAERCVDDVCCDNACDDLCESCDQTESLGECTPIPAGENPDGDCDVGDLQACTGGGACKGLPGAPCSSNGQCLSGECNQQSDSCD
jgi:hypothetical protein